MVNPYEAPQTTDAPLAREVLLLDPQVALQQGSRRCSLGGKLLMAAAISEFAGIVVLIWIQEAKQHGTTNLLNLCGWILLTGSWLLLLAGAIVNLLGYTRFIRFLDHETLVKIFRDCRRVVWAKCVLVIAVIVAADLLIFENHRVIIITLCAMLLGMVIHSYSTHAKAMRIWGEHFPDPASVVARRVYLLSGIAATVFAFGMTAYFFQEAQEPSRFLLMGVMLFYALSFAAFADFYGRLSKALTRPTTGEVNVDAIH